MLKFSLYGSPFLTSTIFNTKDLLHAYCFCLQYMFKVSLSFSQRDYQNCLFNLMLKGLIIFLLCLLILKLMFWPLSFTYFCQKSLMILSMSLIGFAHAALNKMVSSWCMNYRNKKCYEYLWIISWICIYMHVSLWFLSFSILCIMFMYHNDGCEWWLCRVNCVWWMFKHELFIEGRWILKMQVKCMFQFNTSGSRIKIHNGITDM